jgi:tetratricopeptide (TPR) repeat protein
MSPFLQHDLKEDVRLDSVDSYRTALKKEMEALRQEDRQLFPVFSSLAMDLEPTNTQAQDLSARLRDEHVARRLTDLERLYVQCKLIRAETYLEDREKLRAEFKNVGGDVEKQNEHDRRLVDLLRKAVGEVDEASKNVKERHLHLEFRQSELLWELSSATAILAQTTGKAEDRELAESYRNRSLQIARDIADHFPKFPKHAQAMFFCGFALLEMDRVAEGSEYLQKYVEMYPKHAHVPDAYRILADIQFDSNHFPQAEALYTKILPFQSSSIVGYALYKIGWCNYNQHNMAKALLGLEQAILWAKSLENSAQVLSLRREARRDLISIFAEIGDYKKALEYFDRFIGGDSASWLAELAKQYDESGLFEKSTYLYRQLLSLDPPTDQKIAYQTAIIHGAYQLRRWDQVLEATKELMGNYVELLQPVQDSGTTAYNTEKVLSQVALAQHFEFAKTETLFPNGPAPRPRFTSTHTICSSITGWSPRPMRSATTGRVSPRR